MIGKAALRRVKLIGRHAKVKQSAVQHDAFGQKLAYIMEIPVNCMKSRIAAKPFGRGCKGIFIPIDAVMAARIADPFKNLFTVTAAAQRPVGINAAGSGR